jgi:uncharacterized protein
MVLQRVSLVTIGCYDFSTMRKFYQDLGWNETGHNYSDYAVFQTAGVLLSLWTIEKLAQDSGLEIPNPNKYFKGITFSINVDETGQVDGIIAKVRSVGAKILNEPNNGNGGFRSASFADPEYNIWEVAFNPVSTFDERGAMLTI